jgi:hypothetical protein
MEVSGPASPKGHTMLKYLIAPIVAALSTSPAAAQFSSPSSHPVYERGREIVRQGWDVYQQVKPFKDAYNGANCVYRGSPAACGPFVAEQVFQGVRRGGQVIIDSAGATQQLYHNYYNGNTWNWLQIRR